MLDLYIKLKNYDNTKPEVSLQLAAQEIEQLNIACSSLLVNGPIKVNPNSFQEVIITEQIETSDLDSEGNPIYISSPVLDTNGEPTYQTVPVLEGFIGDVNTIPNEFGYVTVRIENYESFEWEVMPSTFVIVSGYPRRGVDGNILPGEII